MVVEERTVEVNGSSVRYLAAGEGPPLVLLHALGESALDWRRWVMPALARRRSVYAPDLLGPKSGRGAGTVRRPLSQASSQTSWMF